MGPARQTFLTDHETPSNRAVSVVSQLAAGRVPSQVAKSLKLSRPTISYYAARAVKRGVLTRITKNPAIYSPGPEFARAAEVMGLLEKSLAGGREISIRRVAVPHRLGFCYYLKSTIRVWPGFEDQAGPKNWKQRIKREPGLTIRAYPNKVHFWVTLTAGESAQKQLDNAVALVNARAQELASELRTTLLYHAPVAAPEWVVCDKPVKEYLASRLGLKFAPVAVGASEILMDDTPEPDSVEVHGPHPQAQKIIEGLEFFARDGGQQLVALGRRDVEIIAGMEKLQARVEDLTFIVEQLTEYLRRQKSGG